MVDIVEFAKKAVKEVAGLLSQPPASPVLKLIPKEPSGKELFPEVAGVRVSPGVVGRQPMPGREVFETIAKTFPMGAGVSNGEVLPPQQPSPSASPGTQTIIQTEYVPVPAEPTAYAGLPTWWKLAAMGVPLGTALGGYGVFRARKAKRKVSKKAKRRLKRGIRRRKR